uniref:Uncharacterized protein n=1 Tax=Anopheles minimus TaxID=112268 RepID=A0A182WLR8_9DIPT
MDMDKDLVQGNHSLPRTEHFTAMVEDDDQCGKITRSEVQDPPEGLHPMGAAANLGDLLETTEQNGKISEHEDEHFENNVTTKSQEEHEAVSYPLVNTSGPSATGHASNPATPEESSAVNPVTLTESILNELCVIRDQHEILMDKYMKLERKFNRLILDYAPDWRDSLQLTANTGPVFDAAALEVFAALDAAIPSEPETCSTSFPDHLTISLVAEQVVNCKYLKYKVKEIERKLNRLCAFLSLRPELRDKLQMGGLLLEE